MIALKKPPMGWNSYDYYDTTVNEAQVKKNADYMAKNLKSFGWEYIVVDIEWYAYCVGKKRDEHQYIPFSKLEMDEFSRLLPCTERFPSAAGGKGFRPLADYVHNLGLKFGIHIMRGIPRIAAHTHSKILGSDQTAADIAIPHSICYWNPDMYGVNPDKEASQIYYNSLLDLYAEWGVDFIKCDDICRMDAESAKEEIRMLHRAIEQCGRDIVLSLSPGPAIVEENDFYHETANMWRITDDFWDSWPLLFDMFDRCKTWEGLASDGGYPDCDMLALGMIGKGFHDERMTRFTKPEQRTMMSLWCMVGSPLMLGAELTLLDDWTLSLITNNQVLSLLTETKAAKELSRDKKQIVWKSIRKDETASYIAVFNISDKERSFSPDTYMTGKETATELWEGKALSMDEEVCIEPHGVCLFEIKK